MIAAGVLFLGALFSLFERDGRDAPNTALLRRASLFLALVLTAILLTVFIRFEATAALLCLTVMLASGERRPGWLALGTIGVPLIIWLVFEIGLGRPLP
jgi:putative tricarboxylic transport membrane protein